MTIRGQILVSGTDDDPLPSVCGFKNVTVCTFKTSPCVPAPRLHVFQHVRVLPVHTEAKVMPRNVWNDVVSWQTRRLNNSTKYHLHALMTIILKKKNWNPWETCQKYALKLFWNACTWHVLEDLIFYGQWTNLHDRSKMDQSLWQTTVSFDLLHSSYMWLQTVLSCGTHCETLQAGIVSNQLDV